jgi:hypothetical protein
LSGKLEERCIVAQNIALAFLHLLYRNDGELGLEELVNSNEVFFLFLNFLYSTLAFSKN